MRVLNMWSLILLAVLAMTASIQTATAQGAPGDYQRILQQARTALDARNFGRGLELLDHAVRVNPRGWEALSLLGRTYLHLERYPQAIAALRQVATLLGTPSSGSSKIPVEARIRTLIDTAMALQNLERSDEAVKILREALALSPDHQTIHHDIGWIYLAIGRLDGAFNEFREELALQDRSGQPSRLVKAKSLEGLAIAATTLGRHQEALDAYEAHRTIQQGDLTLEGRHHQGLLLSRMQKNEEAAEAFRAVLRKDPDHRGALQGLAQTALALDLPEERKRALDRFQILYLQEEEEQRRIVQVKSLLAKARGESSAGRHGAAIPLMEEALGIDPGRSEIALSLADLLRKAGQRGRAEQTVRRLLNTDPYHAGAHHSLGRILREGGDLAGALASMERAVRYEPMATGYHTDLSQLYFQLRRVPDGLRELQLVKSMDPGSPDAAFNLGVGMAQAGQLPAAVSELEEAIRLGFEGPVIYQVLAQIYNMLGDPERSRRALETHRRLSAGRSPGS